ncbi:TlpA family protein disulfide reductase [Hymenobacter setariae]|uniref:TlpA family protein disulfide reductase n=1 Tax=Hymenobacter setariae TaxID=2594794 RepID=A0A558BRG5_9BACT|nr:TlpA disulfide reductase family protein [Hymenobacter setariae]TVT39102.1 TlpA family protein disulfide reductase [Hymenobacter setariae]
MPRSSFLLLSAGLLLAVPSFAQRVAVLKFPALQQRLARPSDTTYVVNFWATWCGPCVQEMAGLEKVRAAQAGKKVKFILVSLDYVAQLEKKVKPFVQKHGLKSEVLLLDETDPNTWLHKVDRQWSGSIPFTLIFNNKTQKRATFEHAVTALELTAELRKFL